jgi:chorismate mutase/prephenate dehydrogenase
MDRKEVCRTMTDSVESLRLEIAELDRKITGLLADRLALVRRIGAAKRAAGLPVRSYATETEVLARYAQAAREQRMDPAHAVRVAREVIAAAVQEQEGAVAASPGEVRRVHVVGGAGKMGQWLVRFFRAQGHDVMTTDPAGPVPGARSVTLAEGLHDADVVLIATPLSTAAVTLEEILGHDPAGLVADIFSLKSPVLRTLAAAAGAGRRVSSLHPLFGPSVRTLSGRVMAVLDCGNSAAADEAAALFRDTALTVTRLPLEQHDAYMQYVLGLSHLIAILFFTTLAAGDRPAGDLRRMTSTTFNRVSRIAADVAAENPYLYYEIQHLNRHSGELYELVRRSLARIEAAALAQDPTDFVQLMEAGRRLFGSGVPEELG